jgi:hypothetical protein
MPTCLLYLDTVVGAAYGHDVSHLWVYLPDGLYILSAGILLLKVQKQKERNGMHADDATSKPTETILL